MGIGDPYAAYCFDEAVYLFGNYVESELHKAAEKAKDADKAASMRQQALRAILARDDMDAAIAAGAEQEGSIEFIHDEDDPVSIETARRMPPAVKFTGRQFQDPSRHFSK